VAGWTSGEVVELCGAGLTLAPSLFALDALRRLLLDTVAEELRGPGDGEVLDRREVTAIGRGALPPTYGQRFGAGRRAVAEHLAPEVDALVQVSAREPQMIRARLARPLTCFDNTQVGLGLRASDRRRPRLDTLKGLREAAPASPRGDLDRVESLDGSGEYLEIRPSLLCGITWLPPAL
jgi:hypothetical protein